MTSTFSFGFSGDDIETGVDENENENENETQTAARLNNLSLKDSSASLPKLVEAERYQLDDWVCNTYITYIHIYLLIIFIYFCL